MSEIPSKMRAVTIGGVGDVHVAEYNTPIPKAGEVLIKMTAASICTIDQRAYNGVSAQTGFPTIPGHEGTGVIAAMGEGVKGLNIGDAVIVGRFGCGVCKTAKPRALAARSPRTVLTSIPGPTPGARSAACRNMSSSRTSM